MYIKYGKSYADMWQFKESLRCENVKSLKRYQKIVQTYRAQPVRNFCKMCGGGRHRYEFVSHGVTYYCCDTCGHINGSFEDTVEFTKKLYESNGTDYGDDYKDVDLSKFNSRVKVIYQPKAEFLKNALQQEKVNSNIKFTDVGAGCGHFVAALQNLGLSAIGVEVDDSQVAYASKILPEGSMTHCASEDVVDFLRNVKTDCVTFIYCLEHVQNLSEILAAVRENPCISYMYFSVPMLSYSVILESISDEVYPRVLGAEHTHIFTDESIAYLCTEYQFEKIAEWRFGADVADLLRTMMVKLESRDNGTLAHILKRKLLPVMDELQYVIDKSEFCSDTHVLLRKAI